MSLTLERRPVTNGHHAVRATTPWWRLLLRLMLRCKVQYLLDAPATHSWLILRRKYDAFTTDYAYDTEPHSWLGPLGHRAARRLMNYPIHIALRERLGLVGMALHEAVSERPGAVRVLTAPCGLCRDIITAAGLLGPERARVTWHALDIDARGDVLPAARQRTTAAQLAVDFFREDLTDPAGLAVRAATTPYDVVNCIGLVTWLDLTAVEQLLSFYRRRVLRSGGRLIIDNWARHAQSAAGEDLEIFANYHTPAAFAAALTAAGFTIERQQTTSNGACTVYIATAREESAL